MKGKYKKRICGMIGLSLLLGGCLDKEGEMNGPYKDTFVRVQEYEGDGYVLRGGEEADKIAEEKSEEVKEAVRDFFIDTYKTDVKVHNIVGNVDGATVFVESTGPVRFYSSAIVSMDLSEKRVWDVSSLDGDVEGDIQGGLYRLLFKNEFQELNHYLSGVVSTNAVVGKTEKSLQNVGGSGYMTPYYYLSVPPDDEAILPVYEAYLRDTDTPVSELEPLFSMEDFSAEDYNITIQLFMEKEQAEPDKALFNQIQKDLKEMDSIPKGNYSIIINDNLINEKVDDGIKDNSLELSFPNSIVKE